MAQVNVNLAFNADTGKAKTQIMELQSLLSKIAYTGAIGGTDKLQTDLHAASEAAKELQFHLNNAFNASTGNFDLSMLDRSLKTSNSNITDLSVKLLSAGATGQQAFVKLAQSISLADQPMFRISNRMKEFAVTMKNTVKWQLSSSMLHGFMGAVQSAYGYAQDLNESLNNIRIVTGYNIDKMAQFAEQANKAAKALSTTTTDYTDASLIYFQQGLSDAEVQGRTDTTIKLANVTGQSVEETANQMTAIWNNFDDGSKSLDYYADVITALGAATASSSKEISEGLNKFSAIAESVGLSYEYASAALATVTATTRQSADVVGNSFKTLFARIQGLNLGETLDDGTTLNKYSEALFKVGINVKDQSGQLKDMNTILDEMGSKWNTLSKDQQVALAQTVGGVRQYTQLIALMDNWDYFQQNLGVATGAEGTLNKQAEIYAESWEAAEKRVQAAAEGIYQSLLDDKFFISLNNGFAIVLKGIDAFIDGAGGVKTVLTGIAGIIMTTFANKIPQALDTFKYNLKFLTKGVQSAYDDIQIQMEKATQQAFKGFTTKSGEKVKPIQQDSSMGYQITTANELTAARNKLALINEKMSASERQMANAQLGIIENIQQEVITLKQKNEALQESIKLQQDSLRNSQGSKIRAASSKELETTNTAYNDARRKYYSLYLEYLDQFNGLNQKANDKLVEKDLDKIGVFDDLKQQYSAITESNDAFSEHYRKMISEVKNSTQSIGRNILEGFLNPEKAELQVIDFKDSTRNALQEIQNLINRTDIDESLSFDTALQQIKALEGAIPKVIREATGLSKTFATIKNSASLTQLQKNFHLIEENLKKCQIETKDFAKFLRAIHGKEIDEISMKMKQLRTNTQQAEAKARTLQKLFNEFNPMHTIRMSEALGSLTGMMSNAVMIGNSLKSMFNAITNPDLSGWERFSTILTGLTMIIPSAISLLNGLGTVLTWIRTVETASTTAIHQQTIARNANIVATGLQQRMSAKMVATLGQEHIKAVANIIAQEKEAGSSGKVAAAKVAEYLASTKLVSAKTAEQLSHLAVKLGIDLETASIWKLIGALLTMQVTIIGITAPLWAIIAAFSALAAIITLVVKAAIDSYNADAKAAENARKAVEDLTESYKRLTDEANAFKDAVSSYEDAVASLKDLEKGTDEYREALEKANEQARQLIETYGLWGQTHYDKNGVITFNEGVLESKQTEYDNRVREVENQLYGAKIVSNTANVKSETADLARELGPIVKEVVDNTNTTLYTTDGIVPTTSPYGDTQQQQEISSRQLNNNEVQQIAKALDQAAKKIESGEFDASGYATYDEALKAALGTVDDWNNLSNAVKGSIDAIVANKDAFAQLTNTMNNGDAANEYYAGEIIRNTVEEQSGAKLREMATGTGGKVDEGLYNQLVNAATEREKTQQKQYESGLTNKIAGATNYKNTKTTKDLQDFGDKRYADVIDDKTLAYRYAKDILGYTDEKLATFDYKSGNGVGTLVDAKGNKIIDKVNDEYMRQQLARKAEIDMITKQYEEQYAGETGEGSAQAYIDSLGTMVEQSSTLGDKFGVDFTDHLLSAIANGTGTFDFSSLYSELSKAEKDELIAMEPDELVKALGLTEEMLAQMGFVGENAATQFATSFKNGLEGWDPEDFTQGINAKYEKKAEDYGIDVDEFKAYRDLLLQTNSALAEQPELLNKITLRQKRLQKGIKSLSDNWEDFNEAISSGDIAKISEVLPEVNDALKDMLDLTDEEFKGLSPDFAVKNWELIQDYMNGVEGSYERIQAAAAAEIVFGASYDLDGIQESEQAVIDEMLAFQAEYGDLEIGATIDTSEALAGLWSLYDSGKMTVGQLQEAFNSLGWEPEIEYVPVDAETAAAMRSAGYQEYAVMNEDGSMSIHSVPLDGELVQSSDQQYYIPKIKSKNTTNTGGSRPPSPPGHTDKGGGGGGSAPKHAEKKNDSDKERYHTLQNQLEDLKSEYDSISEAADRAFGKEKLKAIDDEINKTDELINKQEEYLDAIKENLPVDKAVMDAYYTDLIGGTIKYDERGNISNYDQIQDAMFAKYNKMADRYDEDSEEWQVFEKKYEQLEKYIEQYEETYDLLRDEETEYQDLLRQRIDLQLEKVQYSIEIQLEVPENEIAIIEYQLGRIEDDAFKSAEAIGLLTKKAENIYDQIQVNKQGLNDLLELSLSTQEIIQLMNGDMSVLEGKTFTEDQIDAIKDYRDNLLDLNEEFDDIRENIEEQVMEVFDAWNEKLEQGIDKLDHYGNVLESYKNIIDIVGKDTLGLSDAFMATLNQSSIDNAINKVTATKKSYEAMIDAQSQAEQALEEAKARNDEVSIKMWEENLQSITEEAQSAREEMLSAWEDALDGIAEQFEATVERVVDIFNKEIYTLGGLEGLSEDFSRQQENADIMLDDYQKIYELSKLSRDINKSIDDTDSISGKQKLKKLLEQINKLQEHGVEMSQYDLEYMQKTYDLRLAEIELEEAQRAKNTVRLRKDNEGNWSYVYTQNMDAVDTAQQKYEDALYAMQDVSSNYIDEMSEKLISTSKEMEEALAAIRIQDYANIDDYYAEVQRVQKQYEDELAIQQKELQKAIDNNKILYDEDWTNYHNATGYKISDTENFATTFRDTLLGSLMGSEEDTANFTDIISSAVNTLTQGLMQGAEVYYANLQDAMNAAGTSTEDFAKDFEEKIKEIEDKSEESTNKIKDLAKDMSSSLKDITDSVTTWQETYGEVMQQIINSNLDVINSFNDMLEALSIDKNSITVKYDILSDDTKKPEQYASGGYTGKWGNYGKLAILDEKELILNKDDTVNFLDALGIAKQIIDTIDLNALQASYGFGNLVPATINENNSQTIEQDVHITAEFPNATDHNEIEQAFETLINKASQYANRK